MSPPSLQRHGEDFNLHHDMKQAKDFIFISITKKPISIVNVSPFRAALLSASNANKSLRTLLFRCTAHPKESLGFQVKTSLLMTPRLSRIPGGTQLMSSLLTFSLPGNICSSSVSLGYCLAYKRQICLDDRQGPCSHPASPCLSFEGTDSTFQCRCLVTTSHKDPQESPDFPSQAGACRNPTQQLGAASDCSKLSSAAITSQGLLQQQLGLARVHRWLKPPSWLASATSQACSPMEGTARGCCRGQAPEAQGY